MLKEARVVRINKTVAEYETGKDWTGLGGGRGRKVENGLADKCTYINI